MNFFKKFFGFFFDKSLLIFAIIGGINTIITMTGNFLLQNYAHWGFFAASAIMFAICSVPSFYFNRKYSFKSKAPLGKSIAKFASLVTACFLISYALTQFLVPWMKDNWFPNINPTLYTLVKVVGIQVVFTLLNYVGQRLWAFKAEPEELAAASPDTKTSNKK